MAESSWLKRIWDNLTGHTYVPSSEAANDTPTAPQPITPPVGLTLLHTLEGNMYPVWSVAWSPDGKLLITGSSFPGPPHDADVRIWRTDTWEPIALLTGLKGFLLAAWHPHLPLVVTPGQQRGDVFIWHLDLEYLHQASPKARA